MATNAAGVGRIALRPERADDDAFLLGLYASTRAEEMALTGWPIPQQQQFLAWQFSLQRTHYRTHYAAATFDVITLDDEPIGRMYVFRQSREIRLMEISIEPRFRRRGIGSHLLRQLIDEASREGLSLTLHVEPSNPAVGLYKRFGFRTVDERGANLFMELSAPHR